MSTDVTGCDLFARVWIGLTLVIGALITLLEVYDSMLTTWMTSLVFAGLAAPFVSGVLSVILLRREAKREKALKQAAREATEKVMASSRKFRRDPVDSYAPVWNQKVWFQDGNAVRTGTRVRIGKTGKHVVRSNGVEYIVDNVWFVNPLDNNVVN